MAITVDNWSSGNQIGSSSFNPNTVCGTLSVGDVLFLQVETANEPVTLSTPGGFIEIGQQGTGTAGGSTSTRMALYYQQVTSLPLPSSCVVADAGDHITIGVMVVHGCVNDGGQPFIDPVWRVNTPASTTATWDAADNPNNNSALLLFGADGVDSSTETMQTVTNSVVGAITTANSTSPSSTGYSWAHSLSGNGGQIVAAFKQLPVAPGSTGTSTAPHTSFVSVTATVVLLSERRVNVAASDAGSGTDASSVKATVPAPEDTSAVSEPPPTVVVRPSDAGAVTESARVIVAPVDTASAGETTGVRYSATVADTAAVADDAAASSRVDASEAGQFTESATVTVRATEAATGGDVVAPMDIDLFTQESVTAVDAGAPRFASSDTAQTTDSGRLTIKPTEAGALTDKALLSVRQTGQDLATGIDSARVTVYATTDEATLTESAFVFIEGVGVVGNRVFRVTRETRRMRLARDPHTYQVKPENRLRIFGRDNRTVKVAPSYKDPKRVYSVDRETDL